MMIYRQVKDGVIVNRVVVPAGMTPEDIPADWPERETYEPESEEPPPQIGWRRNAEGGYDPPPPGAPEQSSTITPDPRDAKIEALEAELIALKTRLDRIDLSGASAAVKAR